MVKEATANISRMIQMAEVKGLSPQTISIRYDNFELIAMPVGSSGILIVLCKLDGNTSLVATTACMLEPELKKMLQQTPKTPSRPKEALKAVDEKTSHLLGDIKQALFDTVGPIAGMVYDDCLEHWTTNGQPETFRISELFNCISEEIDNPKLFSEFKEIMGNRF